MTMIERMIFLKTLAEVNNTAAILQSCTKYDEDTHAMAKNALIVLRELYNLPGLTANDKDLILNAGRPLNSFAKLGWFNNYSDVIKGYCK